jgi:hypothetical protein
MNQIPLSPAGNPKDRPRAFSAGAPEPERRSIFRTFFRGVGWLGSSPVHWLGMKSIRQGASFIGDTADRARARSSRDPRFKTAEAGTFDLPATAFGIGLTVSELEARLTARRRQTAVTSYILGVLAAVLLLLWLCKVVATPMAGGRLVLAIDFLPLCLLFVLLAFYQALINFQIRLGRTAGWREYLTTDDGFWPRA